MAAHCDLVLSSADAFGVAITAVEAWGYQVCGCYKASAILAEGLFHSGPYEGKYVVADADIFMGIDRKANVVHPVPQSLPTLAGLRVFRP
jgi:hypothetical protein